MDDKEKLIQEYPEEYCRFLEEAYGPGMLSEGGSESIDLMFNGILLDGKHMLDIGSGLGGMAYYLASKHNCKITGIELNPNMVDRANKNIPSQLRDSIEFVTYGNDSQALPFESDTFDIISSRGVFVQVGHKEKLFNEAYRVLKRGGYFIIDDWLSPYDGKWGDRIAEMKKLEDLTLYAVSEKTYLDMLKRIGFQDISIRDANPYYQKFNQEIINQFHEPVIRERFINQFDVETLEMALKCYSLILEAIKDNELLNRWFNAAK